MKLATNEAVLKLLKATGSFVQSNGRLGNILYVKDKGYQYTGDAILSVDLPGMEENFSVDANQLSLVADSFSGKDLLITLDIENSKASIGPASDRRSRTTIKIGKCEDANFSMDSVSKLKPEVLLSDPEFISDFIKSLQGLNNLKIINKDAPPCAAKSADLLSDEMHPWGRGWHLVTCGETGYRLVSSTLNKHIACSPKFKASKQFVDFLNSTGMSGSTTVGLLNICKLIGNPVTISKSNRKLVFTFEQAILIADTLKSYKDSYPQEVIKHLEGVHGSLKPVDRSETFKITPEIKAFISRVESLEENNLINLKLEEGTLFLETSQNKEAIAVDCTLSTVTNNGYPTYKLSSLMLHLWQKAYALHTAKESIYAFMQDNLSDGYVVIAGLQENRMVGSNQPKPEISMEGVEPEDIF